MFGMFAVGLSQTRADPTEEALRFLAVPGSTAHFRGTDEIEFQRAALPKELLDLLDHSTGQAHDGKLPSSFFGYLIDLNNDLIGEYAVETTFGGSGGPHFLLAGKVGGVWKLIGQFHGGFHVVPSQESWVTLICYSRGGNDKYSKQRLQFTNGEYRQTRIEKYDHGHIETTLPNRENPANQAEHTER